MTGAGGTDEDMTIPGTLVHASAVRLGDLGFLFVGPSGSGKSRFALHCLTAAQREGTACALIADDQVFLRVDEGKVQAQCPPALAGLIEIRGSGLVRVAAIASSQIDFVVKIIEATAQDRLPPPREQTEIVDGIHLPVLRLSRDCLDPYAIVRLLCAQWPYLFGQEAP
jgi:serine kinase of HPr protein (carbohydrate metabolism regulator)